MTKPRVFLDTSVIIAALWSATGGAREILRLGEIGLLVPVLSTRVLAELEAVLSRKAAEKLPLLAVFLESSAVEVVPSASARACQRWEKRMKYAPDARILADALGLAKVDYFTTLDKIHFLSDQKLRSVLPIPIGSPGDLLAWFRQRL